MAETMLHGTCASSHKVMTCCCVNRRHQACTAASTSWRAATRCATVPYCPAPAHSGCSITSASRAKILSLVQRSEEHTSELQSLMRISYAVFCLKKKNIQKRQTQ